MIRNNALPVGRAMRLHHTAVLFGVLCWLAMPGASAQAPAPQIDILNGCTCRNNATTLADGQFAETLQITAGTGQTWTVSAVSGFFAFGSPNPPSPPIPLSIGTSFVETPAGSGLYLLAGIHIDNIGYTLTATNGLGTNLTVSNNCSYPNPAITTDFSQPICLNSAPITLTGNPGDLDIVTASFTVNNQPAATFSPSQLGIGQHIIKYTVNGGFAQANGATDPGCIQSVTKTVSIAATPSTVTCNDFIEISLNQTCNQEISPDMVLEGSYGCYDDYQVTLTTIPAGQNIGNTVTPANIGQTLTATVKHLPSGNTCWGHVIVMDALPPTLACADITASCAVADYSPEFLAGLGIAAAFPNAMPYPATGVVKIGPNIFTVGQPTVSLFENCSNITLQYTDAILDLPCGTGAGGVNDASAHIVRTWTATDASGNLASCLQNIYVERIHADDVIFPADITISCVNANTAPANTGVPFFTEFGQNFPLFPAQGLCEMGVVYEDLPFDLCDGTYKILRTWTVLDWCLPTNPTPPNENPRTHIQVIKVVDDQPPVFQCPPNVTVSTNAYDCFRDYELPDVIVEDACSRIDTAIALYSFGGIWHSLPDSTPAVIADFLGNNHWLPDTLAVFPTLKKLPEATTTIEYRITDDCGNMGSCQFTVHVSDNLLPAAVCKQLIVDTLSPVTGYLILRSQDIDDGSYANCINPWLKVRRLEYGACQPNDRFLDVVAFCCEDVGDTIDVVLRAFDVVVPVGPIDTLYEIDNSNDCIARVVVLDGTRPKCTPPANVTVTCENFNPTLAPYGQATGLDNCVLDTMTEKRIYTAFDTICNRGTIIREWTATDAGGLTGTCTQRIQVNYVQNYHVRMPDDVIVQGCSASGLYGGPTFNRVECENMRMTYTDQIVAPAPGACYRIDRTWTIYNNCTYNPATPCVNVPNPMPDVAEDAPANLLGPVISPSGTAAPWAPTNVKLTPQAPTTTNFSTFWSATANCYRYTQRIKVNDLTPPTFPIGCYQVDGCDTTANDPLLWNDPAWFDPVLAVNDLPEAPLTIETLVKDDCGGSNVAIGGYLYLNLDGDSIQETVLRLEDFPLNPGVVPYDNYQNPNFVGGTLTEFDQRPVPINEKYRFALRQTVTQGQRRASIRWNTIAAPTDWLDPHLPPGKHTMQWIVTDGCGNRKTCETSFIVRECTPPTLLCAAPLNIVLNGYATAKVHPADFLLFASDNNTPTSKLQYAIRVKGNGHGFPLDPNGNPVGTLEFDCPDAGTIQIDLWVRDLAGNTDSCTATLNLIDNGACSGLTGAPRGWLRVNPNDPTSGVGDVKLDLTGNALNPIQLTAQSDTLGNFAFAPVPLGGDYTITPTKDNDPLNGVSTFDLLLISKHILGVDTLDPLRLLAADANRSGSVTSFDMLELRKLILGLYTDLPQNTSWRFFPKDMTIDPANPFGSLTEIIQLSGFNPATQNMDFVAVKTGDTNGNAKPNNFQQADDRTAGTQFFEVKNQLFRVGDTLAVQVSPVGKLPAAFQFTLNFNELELLDIRAAGPLRRENFAHFADKNAVTVAAELADTSHDQSDFTLIFRAKKSGSLRESLRLGSQITPAAAFRANGEQLEPALQFVDNQGIALPGGDFQLLQNTPNPVADGRTSIAFHLPEAAPATLTFTDPSGRTLKTLRGDFAAGWHELNFKKGELPAGVLFYKIEAAGWSQVRKMAVME